MAITTTKGKPGEGMTLKAPSHTPGPWLEEEVTSTERHVFDSLGEDGLLGPIAVIAHGDPDELKANARLIAAAPELLAELIKMTEYAERLGARPCSAWAVIAKATGKGE